MVLCIGVGAHAQSFRDSVDAYKRGDYRTALTGFRVLAEQGNPGSQYNLGMMYVNGHGVVQSDQEAFNWFRMAAVQGVASAQYNLGVMYASGQGVPQNDQEAVNWYRMAAEQGVASAQQNLGVMYADGRGVPRNDTEAVRWYRQAAEQGHASAQYNLGVKYAQGQGVALDYREAVNWYLKAAEQGDVSAQYNLGVMYANGRGVPQNDREAGNWFRRAAEQGYASAQYNLGVMYDQGKGVPKDEQLAYFWWLLASANGHKNAEKNRDLVERDLSADQRSQAQTAARSWKPTTAVNANTPSRDGVGDQGGLNPAPSRIAPASQQADSTGSGFRVARGAIVTNHHVVEGCSRLRVNGVAAQVRGTDARSDLALLSVSAAGPSTRLRAQRAAIGEPVAVAGYPLRGLLSGFNMTTGNLSSLSGVGGDTRLVQITAPVQPGNSGGPLLDSTGNLMGVVVSKLDAIKTAKITGDIPQNVNFAINANVLRSFLDAYSVDYETASSERAIATTAIAEKAKGFTVLVECWK